MAVRFVRHAVLGLVLCAPVLTAYAQTTGPVLAKITRGGSWRVFGVDVDPTRPVLIANVEEIRQQNPPSQFAVSATNHGDTPIDSYVIAAAVVTSEGDVRALQPLAAVKNLKPGQTRRQQTPLRTVIISESERIAFVVSRITVAGQEWTLPDAEMRDAVKRTAQQIGIP